MMTSVVSFRFSRWLAGMAVGAAFLMLGPQGARAHSADDMTGMEGMHHEAATDTFSFGEPGKPAKADRTVKITMLEISFKPASVKVKAGQTIRFVVTNRSDVDHDFTIGDVAAQTAHRQEMAEMAEKGGEMHHDDDPNAISVKAGQTGELTWKFTQPGSFEFDCNIPGHYEAGMKGVIAVAGTH